MRHAVPAGTWPADPSTFPSAPSVASARQESGSSGETPPEHGEEAASSRRAAAPARRRSATARSRKGAPTAKKRSASSTKTRGANTKTRSRTAAKKLSRAQPGSLPHQVERRRPAAERSNPRVPDRSHPAGVKKRAERRHHGDAQRKIVEPRSRCRSPFGKPRPGSAASSTSPATQRQIRPSLGKDAPTSRPVAHSPSRRSDDRTALDQGVGLVARRSLGPTVIVMNDCDPFVGLQSLTSVRFVTNLRGQRSAFRGLGHAFGPSASTASIQPTAGAGGRAGRLLTRSPPRSTPSAFAWTSMTHIHEMPRCAR